VGGEKVNLSEGLVPIHSGVNKAAMRSVQQSHNIMASFISRQMAEQFWSVKLVAAAFGVRITGVSKKVLTKVHLLGNHTYSRINISA
jgi:hypothetical protein